jgi:hypothetical protein
LNFRTRLIKISQRGIFRIECLVVKLYSLSVVKPGTWYLAPDTWHLKETH